MISLRAEMKKAADPRASGLRESHESARYALPD
jgi:hypothetical protein